MADDEFTLRQQTERASQAKALLDDPILAEAFAELRQAYIDAILASEAKDTDTRERLWLATTVLTRVRGHLEMIVSNGTIAAAALADLEAKAQRTKRA